jgi:hypothetical protein
MIAAITSPSLNRSSDCFSPRDVRHIRRGRLTSGPVSSSTSHSYQSEIIMGTTIATAAGIFQHRQFLHFSEASISIGCCEVLTMLIHFGKLWTKCWHMTSLLTGFSTQDLAQLASVAWGFLSLWWDAAAQYSCRCIQAWRSWSLCAATIPKDAAGIPPNLAVVKGCKPQHHKCAGIDGGETTGCEIERMRGLLSCSVAWPRYRAVLWLSSVDLLAVFALLAVWEIQPFLHYCRRRRSTSSCRLFMDDVKWSGNLFLFLKEGNNENYLYWKRILSTSENWQIKHNKTSWNN